MVQYESDIPVMSETKSGGAVQDDTIGGRGDARLEEFRDLSIFSRAAL